MSESEKPSIEEYEKWCDLFRVNEFGIVEDYVPGQHLEEITEAIDALRKLQESHRKMLIDAICLGIDEVLDNLHIDLIPRHGDVHGEIVDFVIEVSAGTNGEYSRTVTFPELLENSRKLDEFGETYRFAEFIAGLKVDGQ